jgi:hypothetical protein|tara:strand:- start:349 stop:525 length:177 start_codon:yes stop_codon:yes gene_type:complete
MARETDPFGFIAPENGAIGDRFLAAVEPITAVRVARFPNPSQHTVLPLTLVTVLSLSW